MATKTGIAWTGWTWNPTTGCDQVSPGCDNCYALTMSARLKRMGSPAYQRDGNPNTSGPGFGLSMHPTRLDQPLRWTKPRSIFVNSMSDLFHTNVSDEFIAQVWAVMALAQQHVFQVLTKRHARLRSLLNNPAFRDLMGKYVTELAPKTNDSALAQARLGAAAVWPLPNVVVGVSAEDQTWAERRIPALLATPAATRFLSAEPLLAHLDLARATDGTITYWLTGKPSWGTPQPEPSSLAMMTSAIEIAPRLDWVIVGGESGPGARKMEQSWVATLRDQCARADTNFFFKQAGAVLADDWGCRTKNGDEPDEWPVAYPREFPSCLEAPPDSDTG